jgi:hypothetical protein
MTKFPISWHEECLINRKASLARERLTLDSICLQVGKLMDEISFAERQIAEAKRRGLYEFDPDKFLVKRKRTGIDL